MKVETNQRDTVDIIRVSGTVDAHTSPDLQTTLSDLLKRGRSNLVVEMSEVVFFSSRGIWVLLDAQKEARKFKNRGDLVIASPSEQVSTTIKLAGLDSIMKMYEDVTSAVGNF